MLKISGDIIDKKYIGSWVDKLGTEDIWRSILEKLKS